MRNTNIKYIIFDWSGVINDSISTHLCVVNKIFNKFGIDEISLKELKDNWEQPYMYFYNKYLPELSMKEEEVIYKKSVFECPEGRPYPGIVNVLKEFKKKGIKMVVLSSDYSETLMPQIKSFGLDNVFIDIIFGVHDKSKGIHKLITKNNFKIDKTIFIGDSNHEIEVGKRVGVKTGAVTWGFSSKKKLKALKPDFLIDNIDDLKSINF